MKKTKARTVIMELLEKESFPISAEDIYKQIIDENINLSTVYRTLNKFCEDEIVTKEVTGEGVNLFIKKQPKHKHILECVSCHKKIYLETCPYHKANDKIAKDTGFEVDERNMIIYGKCNDCSND